MRLSRSLFGPTRRQVPWPVPNSPTLLRQKSSKWQNLASEILLDIFERVTTFRPEVQKATLLSLTQVCRGWSRISTQVLYRTLIPKSYNGAVTLRNTLQQHPHLAECVRILVTPSLKKAYMSDGSSWRANTFQTLTEPIQAYFLSESDYREMLLILTAVADCCPKLDTLGLQCHLDPLSFRVWDQELLSPGHIANLISLTISPLALHDGIVLPVPNDAAQVPALNFPRLKTLTVLDFSESCLSSIVQQASLPRLSSLTLDQGVGSLPDLATFISATKGTLKRVSFYGMMREFFPEPGPVPLWYWYTSSSIGDVLSGIEYLSIRLLRRYVAPPFPHQTSSLSSLIHVNFQVSSRVANFAEFAFCSPSLTHISVDSLFVSTLHTPLALATTWRMFRAFSLVLRYKAYRLPSLQRITINWKMTSADNRAVWTTLVFCLSEVCKLQGVELKTFLTVVPSSSYLRDSTKSEEEDEQDLNAWRIPGLLPIIDDILRRFGR